MDDEGVQRLMAQLMFLEQQHRVRRAHAEATAAELELAMTKDRREYQLWELRRCGFTPTGTKSKEASK